MVESRCLSLPPLHSLIVPILGCSDSMWPSTKRLLNEILGQLCEEISVDKLKQPELFQIDDGNKDKAGTGQEPLLGGGVPLQSPLSANPSIEFRETS